MTLLQDLGAVHVVPRVAGTYQDASGIKDTLEAQRALRWLLARAEPVERGVDPEAWAITDTDNGLRITARVLTWPRSAPRHAIVLGASYRDVSQKSLVDATWARSVTAQLAKQLSVSTEQAARELVVICNGARPVDTGTQQQRWRYRSKITRIDVTLNVDDGTPPLITSLNCRPLR